MKRKPYHTELHTANLICDEIAGIRAVDRAARPSRWRWTIENAIFHFASWQKNLQDCFGPLPWLDGKIIKDVADMAQRSGNYPPDPVLSDFELEDFLDRIVPAFEKGAEEVIEKASAEGICDSGNPFVKPENALKKAGIFNGVVFR